MLCAFSKLSTVGKKKYEFLEANCLMRNANMALTFYIYSAVLELLIKAGKILFPSIAQELLGLGIVSQVLCFRMLQVGQK